MEKQSETKGDYTKENGSAVSGTEISAKTENATGATEPHKGNGVMISAREAEEYCEYKKQKKRAEITSAIFRSETPFEGKEEAKTVCETASKHRQAAVRLNPVTLAKDGEFFRERGVKTDCVVGGTGETLPKVKAYEAKCALRMQANEITVALSPSQVENCNYGAIRKELKKLRFVARRATLKARLDRRYSPERMSKLARLCTEVGVDYFSVPRYEGCERLRAELVGGCKLEVSGVETLAEYKKLTDAGVERIVTERIREIYLEWMREVEKITFPERKPPSTAVGQGKPNFQPPLSAQKLLPKPEPVKAETVKNPQTDYKCRLENGELKFL